MSDQVLGAFTLTLIAGLCTAIGGLVVFFSNIKSDKFLNFSMSFAAGVMLFVSFLEMLPDAQEQLSTSYGNYSGGFLTLGLFLTGMIMVYLLDKLLPSFFADNNKTHVSIKNSDGLYRTGLLVAIALAIHNFPEGIATFLTSINDINMGITIALAIALHNIPEGISVATPIYYSTGNKWKAFRYSLFSGLAEPLGALIVFMILGDSASDEVLSCSFALIAGIMVYISLDCLLPSSWELGDRKTSLLGLLLGMLIMGISLIMI